MLILLTLRVSLKKNVDFVLALGYLLLGQGCGGVGLGSALGEYLNNFLSNIKMCMFPICSPWLSNSKTVFVFSLALLFPVKVNILGYNRDFNENWGYK